MASTRIVWTREEREALEEMRRAGAYRSEVDTIRGALWWYAQFLLTEAPIDLFGLGKAAHARKYEARKHKAGRARKASTQGELYHSEGNVQESGAV